MNTTQESTGSWSNKARVPVGKTNRQQPMQTRGNLIMEIAEKIRPWLARMLGEVRDENGMLVQPARVRAIALNMAQSIVKEQEAQATA